MSILKKILSFFGIVGFATEEQSENTRQRIKAAISARVEDVSNYHYVYGVGYKARSYFNNNF